MPAPLAHRPRLIQVLQIGDVGRIVTFWISFVYFVYFVVMIVLPTVVTAICGAVRTAGREFFLHELADREIGVEDGAELCSSGRRRTGAEQH
jgi:hypothetical protein